MRSFIKLKEWAFRSSIGRNIATMATGAALTQIITVIFMPFVTRLYGPVAFGAQGVFISLVSLLSTVAALSYPLAIVLAESEEEARGISRLSITVTLASSITIFFGLLFYGQEVLRIFDSDSLSELWFLVPPAVLFMTLGIVLNQWLVRREAFRAIALRNLQNSLILNISKCLAGFISPTAMSLVLVNLLGFVSGAALALLALLRISQKNHDKYSLPAFQPSLVSLAFQHKDFPLYRMPQNFLTVLSQSAPVLALAALFGAQSAGKYAIAATAMMVPSLLVGNAVTSVLYPRISRGVRAGENVGGILLKSSAALLALGIAPSMLLLGYGPELFSTFFGEEWRDSGITAQLLLPWILAQLAYFPVLAAQAPLRLQAASLIIEASGTLLRILAIGAGYVIFENEYWSIGLYSGAGAITYLSMIWWSTRRKIVH